MTQALLGFGTLFKIRTSTGPDVYTVIGEQTKVTPYALSVDKIDATHEQSPNSAKEFIPGLSDFGSMSTEIHYVPGGAAEALILSMVGTVQTCRTTFPSGAYVAYSAFIEDFSPDSPLDGKMVASLKLKLTGTITPNAAAAPVIALLPSIAGSDGTPSSGDTLTARDGNWANEPTSFTYQWKKDTVNIGGATAKTYTVLSGDSTHSITVAVTATNSAGSATSTSIPAVIS